MYHNSVFWEARHRQGWRKGAAPDPQLIRILQKYAKVMGNMVLDIGCGWGRHLVLLAHAGFEATGLDIAEEAIQQAKKTLTNEGLKAQLVRGDMRSLPFEDARFDAVFSIQAFGYNDWLGAQKSFSEVGRVIKRNGLFYLRVRSDQKTVPPGAVPPGAVPIESQKGITYTEMREGLVISGHHYTLEELEVLSREAGLEIIDVPVDEKCREMDGSIRRGQWNVLFRKR